MTLSAEFSVNGSSVVQAHSVAYGATVTLQALSLEFHGIDWEIVASSKSGLTDPTISLSGAPTGAVATFTQVTDPGDGLGRSWGVKCTQRDQQGNTSVIYRVIGTANLQGVVPLVNNEENWRDATHGWTDVVNQALSAAPGSGGTASAIPAPALVATSNIALTGAVVVDSVNTNTLAANSTVLATAQTATADNGYWIKNDAGTWTRPSYYNSDATVAAALGQLSGAVLGGTLGAGSSWFQSSGITHLGAKTWTKLATPSLLQDAQSNTLPAQTLTQHKGAAILKDPTNGRNTIDYDSADVREYGGNPNGVQQTTHTTTGGVANVALASALTYQVGQWLVLHQAGAAHGMATPGAPIVAVQGTPGTRTLSFKWVALTDSHGYTAASVATTITTANAAYTASTTVTTAITRPAVNGTINVHVASSAIFTVGQLATPMTEFPNSYQVTAIPDGTHVTLRYLGGGLQAPWTLAAASSLTVENYPEVWCPDVASAYRYALYVQRDGTGNYNYYGQSIAHPSADVHGRFHTQSLRIKTDSAQTAPPGIPATAPSADVPNAFWAQITALNGTTATVYPVPITSAAAKVCEVCNKFALEAANKATVTRSQSTLIATGSYYFSKDWENRTTPTMYGSNAGVQNAGGILLFRDGVGAFHLNRSCARQWQPGTQYQIGDKVTPSAAIQQGGTWTLFAIAAGADWAISGTTEPVLAGVANDTVTDNGHTWKMLNSGFTANGTQIDAVGFFSAGKTSPPGRLVHQADLRYSHVLGTRISTPWVAGGVYAAGSWVMPTQANSNGKYYYTATGGTAGGTEPAWGRTNNSTTSDGGITDWVCWDMGWIQGAAISIYVPIEMNRCTIQEFRGCAILLEGAFSSNGGACNGSSFKYPDIRRNTGSGIVARGSDANVCRIEHARFSPNTTPSVYGTAAVFATQDASFYGLHIEQPLNEGGWGFQTWEDSVGQSQCQAVIVNPYIESGGSDAAILDYNTPASAGPGGNYGRPRDGSSAVLRSAPVAGSTGVTGSTPELIQDNAKQYQWKWVPSTRTTRQYLGDLAGSVAAGTLFSEQQGTSSAVTGRVLRYILDSSARLIDIVDHYGGRGLGYVFPLGFGIGIDGLAQGILNEVRQRAVSAIPTTGFFRIGDRMTWATDSSRLAIIATATGGLGTSGVWTASTAYVRGNIVTQSSKQFIMVLSSGTSASGGTPGGFASTAVGSTFTDGGCKWFAWTDADPLLRAVPNWSAASVAVTDASHTGGSGKLLSGGPVFDLAAATANRAIDMLATGAMAGDGVEFRLSAANATAFTWTINDGSGGSAIVVIPAYSPGVLRIRRTAAGAWAVENWTAIAPEQSGTATLVAGVSAAIAANISSGSVIVVTLKTPNTDALTVKYAALGTDRTNGAPGSFKISALTSTGGGALNTADVSTLDWRVLK